MRYPNRWLIGEWAFYEVEDHGFSDRGTLYGFARADGERPVQEKIGELYDSLDRAMVAAVGEKYTGRRGAGGTGVGTAADWFMKMIGADQPSQAEAMDRAAGSRDLQELASDAGAGSGLKNQREGAREIAEAVLIATGIHLR